MSDWQLEVDGIVSTIEDGSVLVIRTVFVGREDGSDYEFWDDDAFVWTARELTEGELRNWVRWEGLPGWLESLHWDAIAELPLDLGEESSALSGTKV